MLLLSEFYTVYEIAVAHVDSDEILVSYDVVSVFTSIPVNRAVEIAKREVEERRIIRR